jgi:hypothetical protein
MKHAIHESKMEIPITGIANLQRIESWGIEAITHDLHLVA